MNFQSNLRSTLVLLSPITSFSETRLRWRIGPDSCQIQIGPRQQTDTLHQFHQRRWLHVATPSRLWVLSIIRQSRSALSGRCRVRLLRALRSNGNVTDLFLTSWILIVSFQFSSQPTKSSLVMAFQRYHCSWCPKCCRRWYRCGCRTPMWCPSSWRPTRTYWLPSLETAWTNTNIG